MPVQPQAETKQAQIPLNLTVVSDHRPLSSYSFRPRALRDPRQRRSSAAPTPFPIEARRSSSLTLFAFALRCCPLRAAATASRVLGGEEGKPFPIPARFSLTEAPFRVAARRYSEATPFPVAHGAPQQIWRLTLLNFLDEMVPATLDSLDPLSPDIMSRQPTLVIGLLGHERHGKMTMANELFGSPVFPAEPTTKLAFANANLYKCDSESCNCSTRYVIKGCQSKDISDGHERCQMKLMRNISLIDCPGPPNFFPTVMGAIGIIDAALLLISAKENCGQPQTTEHLIATEICSVPGVIVIQSNIDAISNNKKLQHYEAIQGYIKKTVAKKAPILEKGANFMEMICKTIIESVHIPRRNLDPALIVLLIESNNVGGTCKHNEGQMMQLVHGIVVQSILKPNKKFEIKPGIVYEERGAMKCQFLGAFNLSIYSDDKELPFAIPGGVISLRMTLDPYVQPETLAGRMLGEIGKLPDTFSGITVKYLLLTSVVGMKKAVLKSMRVNNKPLASGEQLLVIVGSMSTGAVVQRAARTEADLALTFPLCIRRSASVTLCRRVGISWRLAGRAFLKTGVIA